MANQFIDFPPGINVKRNIANISQTSTNNPTTNTLVNTTGNITWTRLSAGIYQGTLTNGFTALKTTVEITSSDVYTFAIYWTSVNTIEIRTRMAGVLTDGLLDATKIEINIYK